jgi:hypothetical protein
MWWTRTEADKQYIGHNENAHPLRPLVLVALVITSAAAQDRDMIAHRKVVPLALLVSAAAVSAGQPVKPASAQVLWQFEAGG